jgi:signal peptidase I
MRRSLGAVRRTTSQAALTLSAAVGCACLVAGVLAPLFGFRPLIFQSGSMSPTIPTGSLALAKLTDPHELKVGDIITVPWGDKFVTHRIVKIGHVDRMLLVTLKGDGNKKPDAAQYRISSPVPRVLGSVAGAGTVLAWFTHAPGVYVLAAYVVLLLWRLQRHQQLGGVLPGRAAGSKAVA